MKRYPKIHYPEDEETHGLFDEGQITIQEKLDGSNFRFALHDGDLRFGSRNTEGEQLQRDQFNGAITYIEETLDITDLREWEGDLGHLVIFGEAMNPHTISYDWERVPEFVGFDIWNDDAELFLSPGQAEQVFDSLGLPMAPVIDTIPAEEWDEYDFEIPDSEFYDGKAEGVVFKNPKTGTYGKLVRDDFKEKMKAKFGASKKTDLEDTELFVEEYVPPARVRSVAHQLVDDGEWSELQMEMMEDLPRAVIRDMATEEGETIFMNESKTIDIAQFRSDVSGRCASVLRQMIDQQVREQLRVDGGLE